MNRNYRINRVPPNRRKRIFERDSYTCFYCSLPLDTSTATLDHIIEITGLIRKKYRKSRLDDTNLVTCCWECNNIKGDYFNIACLHNEGDLSYVKKRWLDRTGYEIRLAVSLALAYTKTRELKTGCEQ